MALNILSLLAKQFNFTFVNISPKDRAWGAQDDDGNWNGLIRMLIDREADVVPCGLTQTVERSEVTDMSIPMIDECITLVAPVRKGVQTQLWVYTEIFPLGSWFMIQGMVLVTALGFFAISLSGVILLSY
jgi:hypothetical protein